MSVELSPWYWKQIPLQARSGKEIFEALFLDHPVATLLESASAMHPNSFPHSRYSICAGQPRRYQGQSRLWTPEIRTIFPFLDQLHTHQIQDSPTGDLDPRLPFQGGWLGWLGYGAAWEVETLPFTNPDPLPFPQAYWYEPDSFAISDHQSQVLWLAVSAPEQWEELIQKLSNTTVYPHSLPLGAMSQIHFASSQQEYESMVTRAKQYIAQGDIFQANLSLRLECTSQSDPWRIYKHLQSINPSPFASFWKTPWGGLISCSPERLVQLQGNQAQTRPIAGTRPRSSNSVQNQRWTTELNQNQKEQAEHIMLVDLERNDLGRVCEWATVQVNELCVIESYSHVMHLVSNVRGTLHAEKTPIDLLKAVFPGGTITGCPKVRCMEIIEELEPLARSLFYGSCGYIDHRGNLDLNILIRTLLYSQPHSTLVTDNSASSTWTLWGQVGAGIVADSQPEQEWAESIQKAQALIAALKRASIR